jgi:hypothetical protein
LTGVNDTNDKVVLYKTKSNKSSSANYYLKEVSPKEVFLSGVFYDKKTSKYIGKLLNSKRISVELRNNIAILDIGK